MTSIPPSAGLSRRDIFQKTAGLATAALVGGDLLQAAECDVHTPGNGKRVLRIAHLTDIHVQPERHAAQGLAACLHHVQEHHRPDLIINTGDTIFDSMAADEARVRSLWELAQAVWKADCSVPVQHAIGNHDVWGIDKQASKTTGDEPLYGKKWVMNLLGWERPYYSFDRAGWHFIALDSTLPVESGYTGRLDEAQFQWLEQDLARVAPKMPVLIFCHIPILSAAAFFDDSQSEKSGNWVVAGANMAIDSRRLKNLFFKHRNVKLCLSGHLHLFDRVDYLGVSYVCNGAVSGGWWRGSYQECEPGYGIIDLYADGSFENQYIPSGWKPQA